MFLLEITPSISSIKPVNFMAIATKKKVKAIAVGFDKASQEIITADRDYNVGEIIEIDLGDRLYV
jgi:hypothetical protein